MHPLWLWLPFLAGTAAFHGADEGRLRRPPKYVKVCRRSDPDVDKCLKASLEKFLESVNSGAPELNLPDVDPVVIPTVEYLQGSGNVSLHLSLKDFVILGLKNLRIMSVKSNLVDNKIEISMDGPYLAMKAEYSAEGRVYTFPISSRGELSLNLTDVSAVLILRLKTVRAAGTRFLSVEDSLVDLLPDDVAARFGDAIDGSNAIGAAFDAFFNRNAHEIFGAIKPKLAGVLADVLGSIADEVLARHPEDVLLPP